ncbi:MAG TPA: hypothetical protein VJU18_13005 [Vicinamibacteria bacterium]|nr:hypothetical protein [Vicinamibacteria bacterium]
MVQFNFAERTIKAKVVYYGPAQSGKTTNLEQIHRLTDPGGVNRLVSLNTAQDRTLFFDLLPFSLGAVGGYDFKVQLYTVPGQVQYNATRRVVLAGADAVVFVADSRRDQTKENQAAFENMKVNLLANRLVPEKIPLVLQYNKQDLPDLLVRDELDRLLNPWDRRAFPAVASRGEGVLAAFVAVVEQMLTAIAQKYNLQEKGLDPDQIPSIVGQAFASVLRQADDDKAVAPPQTATQPHRVLVSQPAESSPPAPTADTPGPEAGLVSEELLHRAIRSNVELAEALAELVRDMNLGLGAILSHAELLLIYREEAREKRAAAIKSIQQEASRLRQIIQDLGRLGALAPAPAEPTPEAPAAPVQARDMNDLIRSVLDGLQPDIRARGLALEVRVSPESLPQTPRVELERALSGIFKEVVFASPPRSVLGVKCERRPVVVRGRGGESRREFLALSLTGSGSLPTEVQVLVQQGDGTAMGGAAQLMRELGGFIRFAPTPDGGLETRVFLPAG